MSAGLIGGLVGGGVVLILIIFGCCFWRRKLKRARSGSTKSGKTMRMGKRPPKSWTQRLKRWTGHPTAAEGLTTEHKHRNENTDADKNTAQVLVDPNAIVLDTNDASQKRFGTIERECHKQASKPSATQQSEDIPGNANDNKEPLKISASSPPPVCPRPGESKTFINIKKEPLQPSASSPPAVTPRPDERKTYVSIKKHGLNDVQQENEEIPNYMSVCDESLKPDGDSPPAVAVRPDERQYVSVKKYPTNMKTVTSTVETPYADKDSTVVNVSSVEQPDYVVVKPTPVDLNASAQAALVETESTAEQPDYVVVKPNGADITSSAHEGTEPTCPAEQPDYVVVEPSSAGTVHNDTELPGADAEQPGYVDLTSGVAEGNPTTQSSGSSDALLRGRAGRQHNSVTGKDDDSEKDARAGLQTWANRPEKADVMNDKATERNCMTYVSVVGDKESKLQGATDFATYLSVVPAH